MVLSRRKSTILICSWFYSVPSEKLLDYSLPTLNKLAVDTASSNKSSSAYYSVFLQISSDNYNSMEHIPSESNSSSAGQDISINYGTRSFITTLTTARHWSLF
jgi:hypothetical protein